MSVCFLRGDVWTRLFGAKQRRLPEQTGLPQHVEGKGKCVRVPECESLSAVLVLMRQATAYSHALATTGDGRMLLGDTTLCIWMHHEDVFFWSRPQGREVVVPTWRRFGWRIACMPCCNDQNERRESVHLPSKRLSRQPNPVPYRQCTSSPPTPPRRTTTTTTTTPPPPLSRHSAAVQLCQPCQPPGIVAAAPASVCRPLVRQPPSRRVPTCTSPRFTGTPAPHCTSTGPLET